MNTYMCLNVVTNNKKKKKKTGILLLKTNFKILNSRHFLVQCANSIKSYDSSCGSLTV